MLNVLKDQNLTTKDFSKLTELPIRKQIHLLENHVDLLDTLLGQFEELDDEKLSRIRDDPNLTHYVSNYSKPNFNWICLDEKCD